MEQDTNVVPDTSQESAQIERFASIGGDAPLSPIYGGPTVTYHEPEPDQSQESGEVVIILYGSVP